VHRVRCGDVFDDHERRDVRGVDELRGGELRRFGGLVDRGPNV
jgi:hypothetical protein